VLFGAGISARRRKPLAETVDLFLCSAGAATVATDRQHQHRLLCRSVAAPSIIVMVANPIMPHAPPPPSVRAAPAQRAHVITLLNKDVRPPGQSRLANAVPTHPRASQKAHRVSHLGGADRRVRPVT